MKTALIIKIVFLSKIAVPDDGFQNLGWYSGRPYYKEQLGQVGQLFENSKKHYKRMTLKEKINLIKKLFSNEIFN